MLPTIGISQSNRRIDDFIFCCNTLFLCLHINAKLYLVSINDNSSFEAKCLSSTRRDISTKSRKRVISTIISSIINSTKDSSLYMYIYVCIYVCMHACMYMYMYMLYVKVLVYIY